MASEIRSVDSMRTLFTTIKIALCGLCLNLPAFAQAQAPVAVPSSGKTLSENIAGLMQRAGEMIPKLRTELESPPPPCFSTFD